jgi:o-succinylbenzoate synthase
MVKPLETHIESYQLNFKKPAKTSRNTFTDREIFLVTLKDTTTRKTGVGECAPLKLLSIDDVENYQEKLEWAVSQIANGDDLYTLGLENFPSIMFGLETALLDLRSKQKNILFETPFTQGGITIPVNGLVWMNNTPDMYKEALKKIVMGFDVIKIKVGALDFDEECRLIEKIRKLFSSNKITLRLDANGGFKADESIEQLKELKRFEIHSIEQPIATAQWDDMAKLVSEKIIPIALDEELIPFYKFEEREAMLKYIKPNYVILKPNLMGGLRSSDHWIQIARKLNIEWWATSALESNIGLNAIAQWVSQYPINTPQGLGTGGLYENNFDCQLNLVGREMRFQV